MTQTVEVDAETYHLLEDATKPGQTVKDTAQFAIGLGLYFRAAFADEGKVLLERRDIDGRLIETSHLDPAFAAL